MARNKQGIVTDEWADIIPLTGDKFIPLDLDSLTFDEIIDRLNEIQVALPGYYNFRFGYGDWNDNTLFADRPETEVEKKKRLEQQKRNKIAAAKRKETLRIAKLKKDERDKIKRQELWTKLNKEFGTPTQKKRTKSATAR